MNKADMTKAEILENQLKILAARLKFGYFDPDIWVLNEAAQMLADMRKTLGSYQK